MNAKPPSATTGIRSWPSIAAVLALASVVVAAHLYLVQRFGVAMPFWDQWDAEGATLLKPWIAGSLELSDLVATHNEHRILPTRLETLALFELTGEWNNLNTARTNAALFAMVVASLGWLALLRTPLRAGGWFVVGVLLVLGVLPFGWENLLVGFQSQFYFVLLSGIWAVALAAARPERPAALLGVVALSVLGCLTMASGMLTPVVAAAVCMTSAVVARGPRLPAVAAAVVLLAIAALAYANIPVIPGHGMLRANGLRDLLHALSHVLGWPGDSFHWTAFWLWMPGLAYAVCLLRERRMDRLDAMFFGLAAWSVAQAVAIAYGRGHDLLALTPRYSDLMLPGLGANAWFCVRLWWLHRRQGPWESLAIRALAIGFALVLAGGLADRSGRDWRAMDERSAATRLQARNVYRYLDTRDPRALDQPFFALPYPDTQRLRTLLDDPAIRGILPAPDRSSDPTPPR